MSVFQYECIIHGEGSMTCEICRKKEIDGLYEQIAKLRAERDNLTANNSEYRWQNGLLTGDLEQAQAESARLREALERLLNLNLTCCDEGCRLCEEFDNEVDKAKSALTPTQPSQEPEK